MNKTASIIMGALLVLALVYTVSLSLFDSVVPPETMNPPVVQTDTPTPEAEEIREELSFVWSYQTFVENEIPHSVISLTATAADNKLVTKEIDTIEGDCNEYGEPDADVSVGSTMIICYYAGLGRYYKVTDSPQGYDVERRVFEESSPDYVPVVQPFEVINHFNAHH